MMPAKSLWLDLAVLISWLEQEYSSFMLLIPNDRREGGPAWLGATSNTALIDEESLEGSWYSWTRTGVYIEYPQF